MQTTFQFHLAKAYVEIPHEILKRLHLNDLPLSRKQELIVEIQTRLDEKLQNIALSALSNDVSLNELESIFVANEEISDEDFFRYLFNSIPNFPQKWEAECITVLEEFTQTK